MSEVLLPAIIDEQQAVQAFTDGSVEKVVERIENLARSVLTDATTDEGRKAIASLAYKVARSKTLIDDKGKELKDEWQQKVNAIDAKRKLARDRLEALKDEVRKPLTDFENAQKARVDGLKAKLEQITALAQPWADSQAASRALEQLEAFDLAQLAEFADQGRSLQASAKANLERQIADLSKREAEQAELERLRKEKAEQEQRDREARLVAEAEARAKAEAAAKVAAAERQAKEAEEKAARAAQAERDRIAAAEKAAAAAQAAREADVEHRRKLARETLADMMKVEGMTEELGKAIITAMHRGEIRHVKVVL